MVEEAATTTPTPEGGTSTTTDAGKPETYTPPASQADLDKIVGERLARERAKFADYDEVKKRAAEYDKLSEAAKTDQQRLEERATSAEAKVPALETENLRLKVALAKGLTGDLVDRLRGDTQEELEKDADTLLSMFSTNGAPPVPDLRSGAGQRPIPSDQNADDWIRTMAGRGR